VSSFGANACGAGEELVVALGTVKQQRPKKQEFSTSPR
jgi:hypothetical protein